MAARFAVAALLALGAVAQTPTTPVTSRTLPTPFGTEDQPNGSGPLGQTAAANGVDQLKLSIGGEREIYVTWHTGLPRIIPATNGRPDPPDTAAYPAEVSFGLHPDPTGRYERKVTDCEKTYYIQDYSKPVATATFGAPATYYVSQVIVHCLLKDLLPKTTYYYRAGAPGGYSVEYSFVTPPATGSNFPVRLGVVADVGNTLNSTSTLQHLHDNKPDFMTIIGDLVYADRYTSAGVVNIVNGVTITTIPNNQSDQLNWDAFGHQLQAISETSRIPVNVLPGNHEIERDDSGNIFQSITARYRGPYQQSKSTNPLYYSFNYGGVHMIMLHAYDGPQFANPYAFPNGGNYPQTLMSAAQVAWLTADLAAVDRTVTPWVMAQMHPPYYNSYVSHYKEDECLQQQIEDIIFNGGVDIFMFGHVHAYERTNRVYKFQNNPCGPVHITIGDGGNIEYGIRQFSDVCGGNVAPNTVVPLPAECRDVSGAARLITLQTAPKYCSTFQTYPGYPAGFYPNPSGAGGFYIPSQQAPWSAFRDPSFGHAIVEFNSATNATISWYKNQLSDAVSSDVVNVIRDPTCANQKGGFTNPSIPGSGVSPVGRAAATLNSIVDGSLVNNIVNGKLPDVNGK